mmetsp:Transcript_36765/g.77141  ORF Transcript_36765/g.77141 Transcript_36765/m.77141 type:complete len:143 (+) Transcript_36765:1276-1704(+)
MVSNDNITAAKSVTRLAPVTAMAMPSKDGNVQVYTGLLDQYFTDQMNISKECVKMLGYDFIVVPKNQRSQYKTIGGVVEIEFGIEIPKVILPTLSQSRHFSTCMQIIPNELGNPGYRVFIGRNLMKELNMDMSLWDITIACG